MKMVLSILHPFATFILDLYFKAPKFTGLLSTRLGSASTTLFNLLLMLDEKKTRSKLCGVVDETMKLLGNSSYIYQNMEKPEYTISKYLGDE